MNEKAVLLLALLALSMTACVKMQKGMCEPPKENIKWFYTVETGPMGTQRGCVLCDVTIDKDDWADWAMEYGNTEGNAVSDEKATPCLYVYPDVAYTDWENATQCIEEACSPDPNTNDPVYSHHGSWKHIKPILSNAMLAGVDLEAETSQLMDETEAETSQSMDETVPASDDDEWADESTSQPIEALLEPGFYEPTLRSSQ